MQCQDKTYMFKKRNSGKRAGLKRKKVGKSVTIRCSGSPPRVPRGASAAGCTGVTSFKKRQILRKKQEGFTFEM